jgi:hypothetical protein
MDIKNIYDAVIFTSAAVTLRDAVMDAIKQKINLTDLKTLALRTLALRTFALRTFALRTFALPSLCGP